MRLQFQLTRLGYLFVGIVALLYLASLTSQSGLLLLLVGLLLGCFGVNGLSAWRSVRALRLEAPRSVHLMEGQRLWQPWRIQNTGADKAGFVQVESPAGTLFRTALLEGNHEQIVVPDLVYNRRGVFAHDALKVSSRYPFGLVRADRSISLEGEVVVCPAVYEVETPRAAGHDVMVGGKHKGQRRSASGVQFAGVRPYQAGDALRQIHWRSSAKGQGLMVKTFDEELSGRLTVMVDSGHGGDPDRLDDCVRAAGSLIFAALDAGHHVEWLALGEGESCLVPPFADGQEVLDALARVWLKPGCLSAEALGRAVEVIARRGAIHLVVTECPEELRATVVQLRERRREVWVYLPAGFTAPADLGVPIVRYTSKAFLEPIGVS